jgi:hypothetical protein
LEVQAVSTRGWYECYVLDEQNNYRTLAMQFYKWGDAIPCNALGELIFFQNKLQENTDRLPVEWLDDLLREQLNDLYESLPPHFSLVAFLFMLQRAEEENCPLKNMRYNKFPLEQRPDYCLGLALGKAMALNGYVLPRCEDSLLKAVARFIAVGRFVRPWKHYGLTWSVLKWLHYLTQADAIMEMGSYAGSLSVFRWDIDFIYRFFIWINPSDAFRVDQFAIELCDNRGVNLFDLEEGQGEIEELKEMIKRLDIKMYSLAQAEKDFAPTEDHFWGPQCYNRP